MGTCPAYAGSDWRKLHGLMNPAAADENRAEAKHPLDDSHGILGFSDRAAGVDMGEAPSAVVLTGHRFRKKPVVIEAFLFTGGTNLNPAVPEWFVDAVLNGGVKAKPGHVLISTLEGDMRANPGDWIIRGVTGELYPCKAEIFAATYEAAD